MKKATRITLIIASACVALGILLSVLAFAVVGFDVSKLSTASDYSTNSYRANEIITSIKLDGLSENITVIPSEDKVIELEYQENSQLSYSIQEEGGSLTITEEHSPEIMLFNFDVGTFDRKLIIKVPRSYTGDLELSTAGGRIDISDIEGIDRLKANTMSGGISLRNLVVKDSIEADCASGDIVCSTLTASTLDIETMSGRITTTKSKVDTLAAKAVSGAISAEVTGAESDYRITAKAVSGNVNVPSGNDSADKTIALETASGSISLKFER